MCELGAEPGTEAGQTHAQPASQAAWWAYKHPAHQAPRNQPARQAGAQRTLLT